MKLLLYLCTTFSISVYATPIIINSEILETITVPSLEQYLKVPIQGCFRDVQKTFGDLLFSSQAESRTNFDPGHLTASALIFNPKGDEILLVYHKKIHQFVYPGGHIEQNEKGQYFLLRTVLREIQEETGLENLKLIPSRWGAAIPHFFQVFPIPPSKKGREAEPSHHHFDGAYIFETLENDSSSELEETYGTRWVSIEDLKSQWVHYGALEESISLDTCALCLKGHNIYRRYKDNHTRDVITIFKRIQQGWL